MPATATNAEQHAFALAQATRDVRVAVENVVAVVLRLLEGEAPIRTPTGARACRCAVLSVRVVRFISRPVASPVEAYAAGVTGVGV